MTESILRAKGVETWYGRVQILHGVDIEVPAGKIVAIIGPNGAGKTTALKALFGLVRVRSGTVWHQGVEVTNARPEVMVRRGVSFVPQGRAIFPSLTVKENLAMGGFILKDRGLVRRRIDAVFQRFPRLEARRHLPAGALSGGEQQMLAMGRGLMLEPNVLLLDEPSVGLAPQVVDTILDAILDINADGVAVVMVEQNAVLALETADLAYLLVMGRNRMQGPGAELLADPEVREAYLGGAAAPRGGDARGDAHPGPGTKHGRDVSS